MDKGIDCLYPGTVVRSIFVDSAANKLYISGIFTQDGNCVPMRGMAEWKGQYWDSIGNATEGIAIKRPIHKYNDTLYMSGNFYDVNTKEYLAKWNGTFWDTIPNGANGSIDCYAEKGGILYVGGTFDYIGSDSTFLIGKYDGSQFLGIIPPCEPGGDFVYSMAFYQDTLYVGGYFTLPCRNIGSLGKWDGTNLQLVGPEFANDGSNCAIQAMVVYQGELYMGGYFLQADGYAGNHIMKWNGTTFSDVGGGMDDRVSSLKVYNGELYVGGSFSQAGSVTSHRVAKWDGTNWYSLTTDVFAGSSAIVEAINVFNDSLIIGGTFTSINGDTTLRKVAKYNYALTGIEDMLQSYSLRVYPNPASDQITIEFELDKTENVVIEIKNILGQTMSTDSRKFSAGKQKCQVDVGDLSVGLYFLGLQTEGGHSSIKIIKQ